MEHKFQRNRKYEFTDETLERNGIVYHRIRAKKSFDLVTGEKVNKGDLGGFLEKESNLSEEGNCWVKDNARVGGVNTYIMENAVLAGTSEALHGVTLSGQAHVHGMSYLFKVSAGDNVEICDSRLVNVMVKDDVKVLSSVLESFPETKNVETLRDAMACIKGDAVISHNINQKDGKPVVLKPQRKITLRAAVKDSCGHDIDGR